MSTSQPPRRGRPALGSGPSTPVLVRMAPSAYDAAHQKAQRERINVPELMRRAVAQYQPRDDDDDAED